METHNGTEAWQHRQAAYLHIVLLKHIGEPVPERLERIAKGEEASTTAVQELILKIRDCGDTDYIEYLVESHPRNVETAELWAWWLKQELLNAYAMKGQIPRVGRNGQPNRGEE